MRITNCLKWETFIIVAFRKILGVGTISSEWEKPHTIIFFMKFPFATKLGFSLAVLHYASITVEPLNKGHFGANSFVPISEGPLSEVPHIMLQWNLRTRDTLGLIVLSLSQRVPYRRFHILCYSGTSEQGTLWG